MELITFIAVVVLAFAARSAHTKINRLEDKVETLMRRQGVATVRPQEVSVPSPVPQAIAADGSLPPVPHAPAPIPHAPTDQNFAPSNRPFELGNSEPEPFFIYEWFKEHTLIKIGSIIFFFGAAWFVTYAFDQNWVPPIIRVMMGLVLALVIYGIGAVRESIDKTQYVVLTALGSGVVFVTVLAAQFSFAEPLLPGVVSLLILVLAIAYTVWAAVQTNTEWLAVAAAVASLFAPEFSGNEVSSVAPLFLYLISISAGLCGVVLFTSWRYVTLTMVSGVSYYALLSVSKAPDQEMVTWLFVILFSLLFLAITSISILRNRVPLLTDGLVLLIVGLLYAYFVHTVATLPALAMFAAAAITAGVGYLARMREVDPSAVLVYAVCSIVGIFAGTAYLFDGVTATFFFAIEAAALVFLAMRFAFLERTIYLASATLIIPFILGLEALTDSAWDTGLLHPAFMAVLAVSAALGFVGLYMYSVAERSALSWLRGLASIILSVWYGFTVITLIVVSVTVADLTNTSVSLWATILLLGFSLKLTFLALLRSQQVFARGLVLWSYILPVGFASGIILQSVSDGSFTAVNTFVLLFVLVVLGGLTALYARLAYVSQSESDDVAWYTLLWTSVLFLSLWFIAYFDTVFTSSVAVTLSSISFTALCYATINGLLRMRVSFGKILPFILSLVIPTITLLPAFEYATWNGSVLSIDAVSLYVHITVLALLARTLFTYIAMVDEETKDTVKAFAITLLTGASILSFMMVWALSHVIASSAVIAVTLALFVYTIVGLVLYVFGKRTSRDMYVRAGYVLLAAVVLRLGLVDAWNMDPFWQIITFLGIGALFILAALLERGAEKEQNQDVPLA